MFDFDIVGEHFLILFCCHNYIIEISLFNLYMVTYMGKQNLDLFHNNLQIRYDFHILEFKK